MIEASWLIGADGGRSAVRKGLGVDFEGFTWPEIFVVVSTPYDFGQHGFARNTYIADPVEFGAMFKVPDKGRRVCGACLPRQSGRERRSAARAGRVEAVMQRFHTKPEPYDIRYKSTYRVHQRVANLPIGRVLLAGDAAHLNNPLGGFGLNSGIHDAVNLCDKLGRLWRGEGGEDLLDLYSRQRRSATVEQVQAMSIRDKRMMEERDPKRCSASGSVK